VAETEAIVKLASAATPIPRPPVATSDDSLCLPVAETTVTAEVPATPVGVVAT